MKIIARDCFYRQGVMALLEEMNFEYTEQDIIVSDENIIHFFIFPKSNAFDIYKVILKRKICSPALVFCASHMIPFLQDVYFSKEIYFISLDVACDTAKKDIRASINCFLKKEWSKIPAIFPYKRLSANEAKVVEYLVKGYKPTTIATAINMPCKYISLYKRSAMRKLKVKSFSELYFKVKLLQL